MVIVSPIGTEQLVTVYSRLPVEGTTVIIHVTDKETKETTTTTVDATYSNGKVTIKVVHPFIADRTYYLVVEDINNNLMNRSNILATNNRYDYNKILDDYTQAEDSHGGFITT